MSVLLALLGRLWPYLLPALLAGAGTGWVVHKADSIAYAHLQTTFASYQVQVADAAAAAQKAARDALQAQIDQDHALAANNEQVMNELKTRAAEAQSHYDADRAFIRSLLNSASQSSIAAPGHPLSQAPVDSGSPSASGTSGAQEMAVSLCADTKAEDERNADRLDALIAELKPQL